MKKILVKYLALLICAFALSIFIYNYVEASEPVNTEPDLLAVQYQKEEEYFTDTNYSIDDPKVILNPYGNSPLTAIVIFKTKDLTTATVTVKGKNGSDDLTHTFTPTKIHILPIYGLFAGYDNKVVIEVSGKIKEITIKTDGLPDDFAKLVDIN